MTLACPGHYNMTICRHLIARFSTHASLALLSHPPYYVAFRKPSP